MFEYGIRMSEAIHSLLYNKKLIRDSSKRNVKNEVEIVNSVTNMETACKLL